MGEKEEKILILENEMQQVKKTLVDHNIRLERVENSSNEIKFMIQDLKNSAEMNMLEHSHRVEKLEELIKQVEQTNREKWNAYDERKRKEQEQEASNTNSIKMNIINKVIWGIVLLIIGTLFGDKVLNLF